METTQRQRLFACYADVVLPVETGGWAEREQWIVMPPCPREFNGGTMKSPTDTAHVFHRHQQRPDHRAVWQHTLATMGDPSYGRVMSNLVLRFQQRGWEVGPLIVVELLPDELEAAASGRTPWSTLNRMKRVAAKRHSRMI
jgi:hypothetical protein